jgi:hypothetical protein
MMITHVRICVEQLDWVINSVVVGYVEYSAFTQQGAVDETLVWYL